MTNLTLLSRQNNQSYPLFIYTFLVVVTTSSDKARAEREPSDPLRNPKRIPNSPSTIPNFVVSGAIGGLSASKVPVGRAMAPEIKGKLMSPNRDGSKSKTVAFVSKSVEVKGKSGSTSSKTVTKKTTVKTKTPKKAYTLAGQKYDPPEEREPLRIFYESLSKQIPSSEMAEFWMMEHGLLSPERSKKAYEKKQRRQQQIRAGTPIKQLKLEKQESAKILQPVKSVDIKAKKRVQYSDDDDDEFIIKRKKIM